MLAFLSDYDIMKTVISPAGTPPAAITTERMFNMKTIRIFLASSITQFEKERYELVTFIDQLGRKFREAYSVDIEPFICENYDHAVDGRMQETFNAILRESDMVFFLFYTRIGEFTEEEFQVAREQMRLSDEKKPKIYTYFKALAEGETMEASLQAFMGVHADVGADHRALS